MGHGRKPSAKANQPGATTGMPGNVDQSVDAADTGVRATLTARTGRATSWNWAVCAALLLAAAAVYAPVRNFGLVNYDDPEFVRDSPQVRAGWTRDGVVWAFTSVESANWFPITRLSHILDTQLWGTRFGPQHLTSVLLHAWAAMWLFAFLELATRARWASAAVAGLFAVH